MVNHYHDLMLPTTFPTHSHAHHTQITPHHILNAPLQSHLILLAPHPNTFTSFLPPLLTILLSRSITLLSHLITLLSHLTTPGHTSPRSILIHPPSTTPATCPLHSQRSQNTPFTKNYILPSLFTIHSHHSLTTLPSLLVTQQSLT